MTHHQTLPLLLLVNVPSTQSTGKLVAMTPDASGEMKRRDDLLIKCSVADDGDPTINWKIKPPSAPSSSCDLRDGRLRSPTG